MARLIFITHPEVVVDPDRAITDWGLSDSGRQRTEAFASSGSLENVSAFWSSPERKAYETAEILTNARDLGIEIDPRLAENDRSATGFLPPDRFEAVANAFFENPNQSVHGWERAKDAQERIASATRDILADHHLGDLAIVSHGAVGTLLLCHLRGVPISRAFDQPSQGHWWSAELPTLLPIHGWRRMS